MARIKTRSTLALRKLGAIEAGSPAWARGGSGRYLWTERDIELASEYVVNGQGVPLPGTELWIRDD